MGISLVCVGLAFADEPLVPYGKVVRDTVEWKCCYKDLYEHLYFADENRWEFRGYEPRLWQCCYIDEPLRKLEIWNRDKKIRQDSINRAWMERMNWAEVQFLNMSDEEKKKYTRPGSNCYHDVYGFDICGERLP